MKLLIYEIIFYIFFIILYIFIYKKIFKNHIKKMSGFLSLIPGLISNPTIGGLISKGISAVGKFFGFGSDNNE